MGRTPRLSGFLAREDQGASALEFALVVPVVLLLLFAVMEGSRAVNVWMVVTQATRSAARFAVAGNEDFTSSGAVNANLTSDVSGQVTTYVSNMGVGLPVTVTVTCAGLDSSNNPQQGDCSTIASSLASLQSVTVQSSCTVSMLTPLIQAITPSITIGATAAMRAE